MKQGLLKTFFPNRFCLPQAKSPTYFNLCKNLLMHDWRSTSFPVLASLGERHFAFHRDAAECLEFKDLLAELVAKHCPKVMPMTYCINEQNWSHVLSELSDDNSVWILKPAQLNNGQHIKIFSSRSELEAHFLSPKRLGGDQVLQRYISEPHLLREHKYSIRMFVVLTNYAGAYLYQQGYFNVAQQAYQPTQFTELASHLTNEHLQHDASKAIQIPSELFDFFPELYAQIKAICAATVISLKKEYPQAFEIDGERRLAIFGFDFMVDANQQVWLLEANHGPCFPIDESHPLQKPLYDGFWETLVASFILPIAVNQSVNEIHYQGFDNLDPSVWEH